MINLIWKCYSYLGMIKVISVFVCNFYYDDMYLPKFEHLQNYWSEYDQTKQRFNSDIMGFGILHVLRLDKSAFLSHLSVCASMCLDISYCSTEVGSKILNLKS